MIICRNDKLEEADLGSEKVMMNMDAGKYYGLNEVGTRIWSIIEKPISKDEIINTLQNEYDVDKNVCKESLEQFLGVLKKEGLIRIK